MKQPVWRLGRGTRPNKTPHVGPPFVGSTYRPFHRTLPRLE
ncbi:hypothetical protein D779_0201 [Imhoffiella purpurea]|uniref:Uncharacterized protein n=1 Tax=Imhoffiella purpurea TaxID=1249627 RepID=W9VAL0_9GAMM|nr:hypothetical protein D779_0201 [Imhoffiella purpurea]